jgi:mono/diheme cytochrome c family protein
MAERTLIGAAIGCLALGLTVRAQPAPQAQRAPAAQARPSPTSAKAREVFLQKCGLCHPPERVTATKRTKAQWEESIDAMITSRGATLTADEREIVLGYLVREHGPASPRTAAATQRAGSAAPAARAPRPGGLLASAGADDKHIVDEAAAARGRKTYAAGCVQCHGAQARGTDRGSNLVRSLVVLRDRYGNTLGPFLRKGHGAQGVSATYTDAQVRDLSHFVHERVNDTLRGSPIFKVQDVLTGNRTAGEAYFNGEGGCKQCHSPTGDLAGIGKRYDPPTLQHRFLFPKPVTRGPGGSPSGGKPVTVTVTTQAGETVSGVLVHLDDFNVSLRDGAGDYRSWKRAAGVTVVKQDPYAAHIAMLDKYTDQNMHDVVAYLESLK